MPKAANDNESELDRWARLGWLAPGDKALNLVLHRAAARLLDNMRRDGRATPFPSVDLGGGTHTAFNPSAMTAADRYVDSARQGRPGTGVVMEEAREAVGAPCWPAVEALVLQNSNLSEINSVMGGRDRHGNDLAKFAVHAGLFNLARHYGLMAILQQQRVAA
jgi:hypothetical protein